MEKMRADERFKNVIEGKPVDRLPVMEWAPWWDLTTNRWKTEGLPQELDTVRKIQLYFGLDACVQTGIGYRTAETPYAPSHGAGIMKNEADYARIKKTMFKDVSKLYDYKPHFAACQKTRDEGNTVNFFTVDGFFWYAREMFGIEAHLYSFYDYPELLHEMCSDYFEWLTKTIEFVGNSFHFDFMSFAEDMSYNHGPMLSKDLFDEFLAPYYKKVIPLIKKINVPVFIDSDGDITQPVDWYAGVGADGMFPLERQAGVDVSLYIKKQPHMTFLGHFDKMCMKFGREAMQKEFDRLMPSCRAGKVIPSVDHQTPPDVSIENYRIYVELLKKFAVEAVKKN